MRLLRVGARGKERPCVMLRDGSLVDVGSEVEDYNEGFFADDGLSFVEKVLARGGGAPIPSVGVRVGPPICRPSKILCIGLNYADHADEAGMTIPDEPIVFGKASNTVVGPYDNLIIPPGSTTTDWEAELGIVIAQRAQYLPDTASAAKVIAGYVISNDVSERHHQVERGGQWIKGKSFESFNPLGPWLVTPDSVPQVASLDMELRVNGEVMQAGSTSNMIFGPAHIVWYLSQFTVLEPGDLINSGTPAGVALGREDVDYLAEGDLVELEITGLGRQKQHCLQARTA